VGTSKKWPGPAGHRWRKASRHFTRWHRDGAAPEEIQRVAADFFEALTATLEEEPTAFGLERAMRAAGGRLVDALDALDREGPEVFGPLHGDSAEERFDAFLSGFVHQVAGASGLIGDAMVRRAVVGCGQRLLRNDSPVRDTVARGSTRRRPLGEKLFCEVYRLFFADVVRQLVATAIAAKVTLAVPVLAIIDPAGAVAEWAGDQAAKHISDPCQERHKGAQGDGEDEAAALVELAHSLITETVQRALGLPLDGKLAA